MNKSLNDEEKQVLKVLYEELARNPETSLTGIEEKTLGYKVGAYLGIGVIYSVAHLEELGLVKKRGGRVLITQKGKELIKPVAKNTDTQKSTLWIWIRDHIIVEIIIGLIVALLAAAIISGWRPW